MANTEGLSLSFKLTNQPKASVNDDEEFFDNQFKMAGLSNANSSRVGTVVYKTQNEDMTALNESQ